MNPWQMAQQLKSKLQTVAWEDGSAEVVFGTRSVFVYAGTPPDPAAIGAGFPMALVVIGSGTADEFHPELLNQGFTIITMAEVAGDPLGEFSVIGSSISDAGKSAGRGVAEVAERTREAVQVLTGYDGAKILVSTTTTAQPLPFRDNLRHISYDELGLTCICTSQPQYAEPQEFARVDTTWTWDGAHCSNRFDFLQYRMGYVSGSTPAEDPGDLDTVVYTGTTASTTHTAVASSAYSVFADYDPRGTGSVANSSKGNLIGTYLTT